MTTLMQRRKKNRLSPLRDQVMTPWNNNAPLRGWRDGFFSSNFDDLQNLLRFDDIFKDDFFEDDSLMPAMNVKEHKNDFEIEFAAPGFSKKDFEVSIENDILHVYGEKEEEEKQEDENFSRKEFSYKSFKRSATLPASVDLDQNLKATYKNGILKLRLLKKEEIIEKMPPKKVIEVI